MVKPSHTSYWQRWFHNCSHRDIWTPLVEAHCGGKMPCTIHNCIYLLNLEKFLNYHQNQRIGPDHVEIVPGGRISAHFALLLSPLSIISIGHRFVLYWLIWTMIRYNKVIYQISQLFFFTIANFHFSIPFMQKWRRRIVLLLLLCVVLLRLIAKLRAQLGGAHCRNQHCAVLVVMVSEFLKKHIKIKFYFKLKSKL